MADDIPDRVTVETNAYYRELKDADAAEEWIRRTSDVCFDLMDTFDMNQFDLTAEEAKRLFSRLTEIHQHILTRTKE